MIIPIVCPKCQEKNKVNGEVVNGKITLQCPKCLAKFSKVLPKIEKEEIKPEIKEEKVEECCGTCATDGPAVTPKKKTKKLKKFAEFGK